MVNDCVFGDLVCKLCCQKGCGKDQGDLGEVSECYEWCGCGDKFGVFSVDEVFCIQVYIDEQCDYEVYVVLKVIIKGKCDEVDNCKYSEEGYYRGVWNVYGFYVYIGDIDVDWGDKGQKIVGCSGCEFYQVFFRVCKD